MNLTVDMRSLSRIAAVAAVAGACLGPARAQEPSAAAIAIARDVIATKGGDALADPLVRGVIESVKNNYLPTNPNLSRELNDTAAALQKELAGKRDEVLTEFARAYAGRFTESELKDLLLFYKTPLGQKFARDEPLAVEDGLRRAQQWGDSFAEAVMTRFRGEMQKKGHPL
jgi:hypothetical protein